MPAAQLSSKFRQMPHKFAFLIVFLLASLRLVAVTVPSLRTLVNRLSQWTIALRVQDGQEILVRPFSDDPLIVKEVYIQECYDQVYPIEEGDVVVDVGAHIGIFAAKAAYQIGSRGIVLAIEPEPRNYRLLQENIHRNSLQNVITLNRAASDTSGVRPLQVLEGGRTAGHSIAPSHTNLRARQFDDSKFVGVRCDTLDNMIAEQGLRKVDLIKIDVEGHEPNVMRGAASTIARFCPKIIVESKPGSARSAQTAEILAGYGYRVVGLAPFPSLLFAKPSDS